MKSETVTVTLNVSDRLMQTVLGLVFGIYREGLSAQLEPEIDHLIAVIKGVEEFSRTTEKAIERLAAADPSIIEPGQITTKLKKIRILRELLQGGMILEPSPMRETWPRDIVELLCSEWMLVDEFLAIQMIANLDSAVKRFMELRSLFLKHMPRGKVREHMVEAIQCYIQGFNQACIIICRSVIEAAVGDELRRLGRNLFPLPKESNKDKFQRNIRIAHEKGLIDNHLCNKADSLRKRGNAALHKERIFRSKDALQSIIETQEILDKLYSSGHGVSR